MIGELYARLESYAGPAFAGPDSACTFPELRQEVAAWQARLQQSGVKVGDVVSVEGEYCVQTIAAFLAAALHGAIVVPLSSDSALHHDEFSAVAQVEWQISGAFDHVKPTGRQSEHPLYDRLREGAEPGLVLFSSGSTGPSKAAVHSLDRLSARYLTPRPARRTLVFLQLDHIGGVNTLLHTISNGGTVVVAPDRSPQVVCDTIARHRVELLPTSPTFLNLLLMSGCAERYDLSSLKLVTYGTEPMPESTLRRLREALPHVRLLQTYGLTELGILRSESRGSDSLWVRVGGPGYDVKVVHDRLWIKADSAILGYLNAAMPIDEDGYFDTGDLVEVDGDWIRILGRQSEIVNVGGQKVSPAEVESVLLELENVADVVVHGEANSIVGQILVAHVRLIHEETPAAFKTRLRLYCGQRLPAHKIPVKIQVATGPLHSVRFKRLRGHGLTVSETS